MTALDYILVGLEKELELERELGVRQVALDRSLLAVKAPVPAPTSDSADAPQTAPTPAPTAPTRVDFAFLHAGQLSADGMTLMAKAVAALQKTAETAPVAVGSPIPAAKVYVALGKAAANQYAAELQGKEVLYTYSPDEIVRFKTVTEGVKRMKKELWDTFKKARQRSASMA